MKKLVVALLLVLAHGIASASMLMEFGLSDGRTVRGRIASQENGVYIVRTEKGEELRVAEAKVKSLRLIDTGETAAQASTPEETLRDAGALQETMMRDEGIMSLLKALQDDPEMQRLLADPEVLAAVASGDIASLANKPGIKALLENPKVREIQRRLVAPPRN